MTHQLVIPASGNGKRFLDEGVLTPKFLLPLGGSLVINHIIDGYPDDTQVTLIWNPDIYTTWFGFCLKNLGERSGRVEHVVLDGVPQGPVDSVLLAIESSEQIDVMAPVFINYCDFGWCWDFNAVENMLEEKNPAGVVFGYSGEAHPHLFVDDNLYGYIDIANDGRITRYTEKELLESCEQPLVSSGTYWFDSVERFKLLSGKAKADPNISPIKGEYYLSHCFMAGLYSGDSFIGFEISHFLQLGTPRQYSYVSDWFETLEKFDVRNAAENGLSGNFFILMAGLGLRFSLAGYPTLKPFLPVGSGTMLAAVIEAFGVSPTAVLVRDQTALEYKADFESIGLNARELLICDQSGTEGQADSARVVLDMLRKTRGESVTGPITFAACDAALLPDNGLVSQSLNALDWDIIVWGVKDYFFALKDPESYGWVESRGNLVEACYVKRAPPDLFRSWLMTGTFSFANEAVFESVFKRLVCENRKTNGEYYLDDMIATGLEMGLRVKLLPVSSWICWGTPREYRTYLYFDYFYYKCFSKHN